MKTLTMMALGLAIGLGGLTMGAETAEAGTKCWNKKVCFTKYKHVKRWKRIKRCRVSYDYYGKAIKRCRWHRAPYIVRIPVRSCHWKRVCKQVYGGGYTPSY